jgi:hypothetical protein
MKKCFKSIVFFSCLLWFQQSFSEKHIIGSWPHGFFSAFFGVLNHLYWCERTGNTPVVYWGRESHYWHKDGYNGSLNAWEYFFEPVSLQTATESEPRDTYFLVDTSICVWPAIPIASETRERILLANRLINTYIKINSIVDNKVTSFFNNNMLGKKTIGIHLRGSEKTSEVRGVDPLIILARANQEAELLGDCQFLVATDEYQLLRLAEKTLHRKVIHYPCRRANDSVPLYRLRSIENKALLGEDVLIEMLLLTQCDLFLHTYSNVSSAVLYFNPSLKDILFV